MTTRHALAAIIALVTGLAAAPAPAQTPLGAPDFKPTPDRPVGWRGDGTGRFPGATPPTAWERKRSAAGYTTKGILWAALLPNRGLSTPLVVGDRVFLTADFADLICLDKQTGKILWIRSNNEFEGLTEAQRQAHPDLAEKLQPLAAELEKANAETVAALNAQLPIAATAPFQLLHAFQKKRAAEKKIIDQQRAIDAKLFRPDWPQVIYGNTTETPASDGKYVCALFATGVAACYDLDGKRQWIARGSNGGEEKGHYSSPLIIKNQFIVWGEPEIRAYDIPTGKILWQNPARGSNCGSLFRVQVGAEPVVGLQTSCFTRVRDGQTIWKAGNLDYSFTTAIAEGDTIYFWAAGPNKDFKSYKLPASTDSGKVTPALTFQKANWAADELAGKFEKGDLNASPLYVDGLIYNLYCGGGLLVHDAATGQIVYRKVLPMKPHTEYWASGGASASPALAGKYIYLLDNQGTTVIIKPGRQYEEVAVNHLDELLDAPGQAQNLACPTFDGNRLYLRGGQYLYCIGQK